MMIEALGLPPRYRQVPVEMMRAAALALTPLGTVSRVCRKNAELARIGHCYATESMLVWDDERGLYDAEATPEFGDDTLAAHFRALARDNASNAHSVF